MEFAIPFLGVVHSDLIHTSDAIRDDQIHEGKINFRKYQSLGNVVRMATAHQYCPPHFDYDITMLKIIAFTLHPILEEKELYTLSLDREPNVEAATPKYEIKGSLAFSQQHVLHTTFSPIFAGVQGFELDQEVIIVSFQLHCTRFARVTYHSS